MSSVLLVALRKTFDERILQFRYPENARPRLGLVPKKNGPCSRKRAAAAAAEKRAKMFAEKAAKLKKSKAKLKTRLLSAIHVIVGFLSTAGRPHPSLTT
jgi:hypothetical protein